MKYLLALLIIVSSVACSSDKKGDIIGQAEMYLKEQLKDPSSYQPIAREIVDTTMMSDYFKREYSYDSAMAMIGEPTGERQIAYKTSAERWLNKMKSLKQDSIYFITIKFGYRAKNGFGALDKYNKGVKYFPSDKSFKIIE